MQRFAEPGAGLAALAVAGLFQDRASAARTAPDWPDFVHPDGIISTTKRVGGG